MKDRLLLLEKTTALTQDLHEREYEGENSFSAALPLLSSLIGKVPLCYPHSRFLLIQYATRNAVDIKLAFKRTRTWLSHMMDGSEPRKTNEDKRDEPNNLKPM
jgi:hypothetical protein